MQGEKCERNRVAAILIGFFLGGFGAHWFYVGNVRRGLMYLVFFWTFIPVFLMYIDIIRWALMSEERWNEIYVGDYHINR